jgi:MGT family glycosyltransferase
MKELYAQMGRLEGRALLRFTIDLFAQRSRMYLEEGPGLLRRAGIELLVTDQVEPAGACVAERLGIPFVTICNALALDQEEAIPPVFTTWSYSESFIAKLRNQTTNRMAMRLSKAWREFINAKRHEWNLREYASLWDARSPLAHLTQQPACFDFPRRKLPPQFHYTGPWHDPNSRPSVAFPFERLDGRPLIYASMGTLQNRVQDVFREIALACVGLNAQLVISLGGGSAPEQIGPLPGNPLVVAIAPQLELLSRAALTITHAGLNTALESLSAGVPMVAIPVGNDQPGVAARIKWVGAGEFLPLKRLNAAGLRLLINQVLEQPSYRERAQQISVEIKKANGVKRAVGLIEAALGTNAPLSEPLVAQL